MVVYGRNHYPDDIEATIQEITRGRAAAIAVPDGHTEKLVAIVELKKRGDSAEEVADKLGTVKREVTSAISRSHGLSVADLVLVAPGSLPITTSGKVRRAACVEQYRNRQFARLDTDFGRADTKSPDTPTIWGFLCLLAQISFRRPGRPSGIP